MPGDVQELIDLKDSVVQHLTPLIENSAADSEQKFIVLLTAARSAGTYSALKVAYEAALKIEDEGARADALLDVLSEADYMIQSATSEPVTGPNDSAELTSTTAMNDYHAGE